MYRLGSKCERGVRGVCVLEREKWEHDARERAQGGRERREEREKVCGERQCGVT